MVKDKADFQSQLKAAGDKLVVVEFCSPWQVTLQNPNLIENWNRMKVYSTNKRGILSVTCGTK